MCEAMLIESAFAVAWCPAVANWGGDSCSDILDKQP